MTRRRLLQIGGVLVAATGLAATTGCSALGVGRTSVRLGIAPGTQTLWRYVAQKKATLLQPLGYDTTFTPYKDENSLRQALAQGTIDVMASLVPTVALLSTNNVAAQLFMPIAWVREGYPWITLASSAIHTLKDLQGQVLSTYPLDHPGFAYWRALGLALDGLRFDQINPIQSFDSLGPLLRHQAVAACIGGDQWAQIEHDPQYRKITDLEVAWKDYSKSSRLLMFGGYLAKKDFVDSHKKFIDDFVQVNVQAMADYKRDKTAFFQTVVASTSGPKQDLAASQALAFYLGLDDISADRLYLSKDDIADYQKIFPLMEKSGFLKSSPGDAATLFYLPNRPSAK